MPKVTIKVTQDHIDAAKFIVENVILSYSQGCPLALALSEAGYPDAVVDVNLVYVTGCKGLRSVLAELPEDARAFRSAFDHDGRLRPFKFDIELPW